MVKINKEEEFELIAAQYQKLIFTVCLSFIKNYFDAEDLTQETFLSAYNHFGTFDGKNPKAWLTAIAANKCRDYLKSPLRKTANLSTEELDCIEDSRASPEQEAINNDNVSMIHKFCGRLKEPYRTVATSYFCGNVKLSQLSRTTGQNLKTLETQLYRAKKLLKAMWEEEKA